MSTLASDPADFRHQAARYARYRRDYSPGLYDAIASHTGAADGRRALDLGCGTGFVTGALAARGWDVVGMDFSAPMLAEARRLRPGQPFARARAEALPLAGASVALVTAGTAFHWFPREATVAELARVLVPGGWAAVFWRYAQPDDSTVLLTLALLDELGCTLPAEALNLFAPEPFAGSGLVPEPEVVRETTLAFSVDDFHGYLSTVEWLRRITGPEHPRFLARLREELVRRHPAGVRERNAEHLSLACKPLR